MNPTLNTCDTATELSDRDPNRLEFPATTMDTGLPNSSFSMLMSQEMLAPHKQQGELESMYAGLGEEKMFISSKRKATTEVRASLPNMSISNKKAAVSGISPRSHGVSQLTTRSKTAEAQAKLLKTGGPTMKMGLTESVLTKPRSAVSRNRVMQSEAPSDIAAEEIDPVRAKFRESLTAALALVLQEKTISLDAGKTEDTAAVQSLKGESKLETSVSSNNVKNDFQEAHSNDVSGEPWKFIEQDFQSNSIFPAEDTPFGGSLFLKDELLQGNGLSWAMDFDAQIAEMQAVESSRRDELANEADTVEKVQEDMSPESVALRIESELFTLFGSVNKKYKEKGRSLLFNLKDRNNPELRERVMSGEISAERLCSMTAEELASKELSQWRMAKAEELDHMKVLPESDTNVRRLVKKTHKGEYQVDFDQDISVVEDIPTNVSVVHENRRKTNGGGAEHRSGSNGAKEHPDGQCSITIPGEGTDILGLMVDDMRDLPPILSLDEFMDSLDKEPPFENLPLDSEKTPDLDKNNSDDGAESADDVTESKSPVLPSKDPAMSTAEIEEAEEERVQPKGHVNGAENQRALEATKMAEQVRVEYLWQGLLQLTLSSTAYVVASYKSGEKTTTRQWPSSFEIKGRVRLDAFDKFLQELPKSRTRSTMVVHFALAQRCTEEERCSLIDLVDSYVTDQRLGYAEPIPGVELYICPPRSKTVDMIVNHLPKPYTENLTDIDNGLIGILVWRKERIPPAPLPETLPNPEKHLTITKPPAERDLNPKVNFPSKPVPKVNGDDDDGEDLPPGFGPTGGNRDDDDLPEFNFSAGPNPSRFPTTKLQNPPPRMPLPLDGAAAKQVEQMRALIQKYGKSEDTNTPAVNGIPVRPWNDDDDDDIPEWQPQDQTAHHYRQPNPLSGFPAQKPAVMAHLPVRPSFQQPIVPVANPMLPVVPPNIRSQAPWRHPGPNTGNRGVRGQPTEDRFYRGRENRDRRSSRSGPYNRSRGH